MVVYSASVRLAASNLSASSVAGDFRHCGWRRQVAGRGVTVCIGDQWRRDRAAERELSNRPARGERAALAHGSARGNRRFAVDTDLPLS